MWERYEALVMDDEPTVRSFMRHLQVCLEEAGEIADKNERQQRQWQLESALQESIMYLNRVGELKRHGIDPERLVDAPPGEETPPAPKKVEALMLGHQHCSTCKSTLEADLGFCAACGAKTD